MQHGTGIGSVGNRYRGTVSKTDKDGYVSVLWENSFQPVELWWGINGQYSVQLDI